MEVKKEMKKYYSEPELEIRTYKMSAESVTTSDPQINEKNDLNKDDEVNYFGKP